MPELIFALAGILTLALALITAADRIKRKQIGKIGEELVSKRLRRLPRHGYLCYGDVCVGGTQLDHVVLTEHGIFVIEVKNYSGVVRGDLRASEWTHFRGNSRREFQNPLHQNAGHIKALSRALEIPEDSFISLVVFTGNARLKLRRPLFFDGGYVIRPRRLTRIIKRKRAAVNYRLQDAARLLEASAL